MYSTQVLAHFRQPHSPGALSDADAVGRAENPVCGDVLELSLRIVGGTIVEARFRAQGCVPVIACGSRITDMARDLTPAQAALLTPHAIVESLGGLPEGSAHAAQLAIEALRTALRSAGARPG
jgi:nitrogen fixation NifU-like protein